MKTLVHAFVTSRMDYGNILVGAPKSVTNKLQRVLNAAARIVTGTRKYDRGLSHLYCILSCTGWTSRSGSCISLLWWSTDVSRTRRRSICRTTVCQSLKLPVVSNCDLPLVISLYWSHDIVSEHSAIDRAFALAGPTFWNSLADELRTYSSDRLKLALKTVLFATYWHIQRIRGFCSDALYKLMIDIYTDCHTTLLCLAQYHHNFKIDSWQCFLPVRLVIHSFNLYKQMNQFCWKSKKTRIT